MLLYGNDHKIYIIEKKEVNGTDGDYYHVENCDNFVAKLYHDDRLGNRGQWAKVEEFTKSKKLKSISKHVIVPFVALYDSADQTYKSFRGYIQPRTSEYRSLHSVLSDENIDYYKKAWMARNLCIAVHNIHASDIVIGDLNRFNILVNEKNGHILFCDADNFQFILNRDGKDRLCPCTIGTPEILNRLLKERASLQTVCQSSQDSLFNNITDCYALAYHVFSLLMGGCSPFSRMIDIDGLSQKRSNDCSYIDFEELKVVQKGEFSFCSTLLGKRIPNYVPDTEC